MTKDDEHRGAEGLWQLLKTEPFPNDPTRANNDVTTFKYEPGHVTLRLLTMNIAMWRSQDDFYKLAAEWRGDMLCYRPPFGDLTELAMFRDGRFVDIGTSGSRIFEKIQPGQVVDWNSAITEDRDPHDYGIRPDGSKKP